MSISYSGITNRGKITLPSVDSWSTNMNILKDPPKSITTRRVDKVGQTSNITQMIDDSGNRVCEGILQYARGVNPMVSVSYSNEGTNGGQYKNLPYGGAQSETTLNFGQRQAFLPYRIGESFRPPVVTASQLMPLSRMPRVWTTAFTQPGFADFSKKIKNCDSPDDVKEVKKEIITTSVKPTGVYKISKPHEKPFEVKYVVKSIVNMPYTTQMKGTDTTTQNVLEPNKEINKNVIYAFGQANKSDNNKFVNNHEFDTDRYIQDINNYSHFSNKGSDNIQLTSINDLAGLIDIKDKDLLNINYDTQKNGGYTKIDYIHDDIDLDRNIPVYNAYSNNKGEQKITYIHDDIYLDRNIPEYNASTNLKQNSERTLEHEHMRELTRNMPEHNAATNLKQNYEKNLKHEYMKELNRNMPLANANTNQRTSGETNTSSTNFRLNQKINVGGFHGKGKIPTLNRMQNVREVPDSERVRMLKNVNSQFEGRYQSNKFPNNF